MAKSYVKDLCEWVKQKKEVNARSANSGKVVFIAIRDDVKEAIDAGYTLVTIWKHLHETGRIKTTYETFRRYVNKYIKNSTSVTGSEKTHSETADEPKKPFRSQPGETEQKTLGSIKTSLTKFQFNPKK